MPPSATRRQPRTFPEPKRLDFPLNLRRMHISRFSRSAAMIAVMVAPSAIVAQTTPREKLDYAALQRIKEEGLQRSQAMDHISWIADVYGPRLTGGPGIRQAADWTKKKFGEWGFANIHEEPWAFGKGWQLVRFYAHMTEPQIMPIIGLPK